MKRKILTILSAVLIAAVLFTCSCKKADVATATLKVIFSAGVSGTPNAGTYTLNVGDQLAYSYTLDEGYAKLTVLLDGTEIAASGTITVSGDHTLRVYSDDNAQFTLTVTLATGVSGTPAAGTFNHAQGTLVDYSYALAAGYQDLVVLLDGVAVAGSGTVTMSADHTISVSATAGKKIQGSWLLIEKYNDGSSFNVTANFSGDYTQGTVTDSDGGSGTYTFIGATVAFTIVFSNVTYEYSGSFTDNDTMSGTCERYQTVDNVISGTWTATRKTSAAAASLRNAGAVAPGKKGDIH